MDVGSRHARAPPKRIPGDGRVWFLTYKQKSLWGKQVLVSKRNGTGSGTTYTVTFVGTNETRDVPGRMLSHEPPGDQPPPKAKRKKQRVDGPAEGAAAAAPAAVAAPAPAALAAPAARVEVQPHLRLEDIAFSEDDDQDSGHGDDVGPADREPGQQVAAWGDGRIVEVKGPTGAGPVQWHVSVAMCAVNVIRNDSWHPMTALRFEWCLTMRRITCAASS